MRNDQGMTCRHEVRMNEEGLVSANGTTLGCMILVMGSSTGASIRSTAKRLCCESPLPDACPFASKNLWDNCPRYERRHR